MSVSLWTCTQVKTTANQSYRQVKTRDKSKPQQVKVTDKPRTTSKSKPQTSLSIPLTCSPKMREPSTSRLPELRSKYWQHLWPPRATLRAKGCGIDSRVCGFVGLHSSQNHSKSKSQQVKTTDRSVYSTDVLAKDEAAKHVEVARIAIEILATRLAMQGHLKGKGLWNRQTCLWVCGLTRKSKPQTSQSHRQTEATRKSKPQTNQNHRQVCLFH